MARKSDIHLPPSLHHGILEAGVDEAGRGCIAGPVVAAAAILPDDFDCPGLTDSKKLTRLQRQKMVNYILEHAVDCAVGVVDPDRIDEINILQATFEAMNIALNKLEVRPQHVIVDGNRFATDSDIPFTTVVKGDAKYANIAAASILAKEYRDRYMEDLHGQYPAYRWNINKGYPTRDHRYAILKHGTCPHHRFSFKLLDNDLALLALLNGVQLTRNGS